MEDAMKFHANFHAWLGLFRTVIITDAIIFLTAAFVCLLAGWHTVYEYGDALIKAGVIFLITVLLIGIGGNSGRAEDIHDFSWTRSIPMQEYLVRSARERDARGNFILVGVIAMAIVIVVGSILLKLP
jgi:hypothetical protein